MAAAATNPLGRVELRSVLSHPFARSANGWGTERLWLVERGWMGFVVSDSIRGDAAD